MLTIQVRKIAKFHGEDTEHVVLHLVVVSRDITSRAHDLDFYNELETIIYSR